MTALSMAEQAAKRVAKGVTWLDKHRPGWPHLVKLATFDIRNPCRCVLGQTTPFEKTDYGELSGFNATIYEVGLRRGWATSHGFDAPRTGEYSARGAMYDALQAEWIRVINERLAMEETND